MWEKSYHTELFTKRNFSLDSIACYNIRVSNNCLKPTAIRWIVVSTSQYGVRLEELLSRTSFLSFLQVATSKRGIYANDCKASTSVKTRYIKFSLHPVCESSISYTSDFEETGTTTYFYITFRESQIPWKLKKYSACRMKRNFESINLPSVSVQGLNIYRMISIFLYS